MKLIGAVEIIFGLALVLNEFVPLALTVLLVFIFNALILPLHDLGGVVGAV